jgi:hypothetical protein
MNPSKNSSNFTARHSFRLCRAISVALCALFLALPAAAQAASNPTSAQYRDTAAQVSADVGSGGPHQASRSGLQEEVGGLPFTGLDLLALLLVATALVSAGFALRWLTAIPRRQL